MAEDLNGYFSSVFTRENISSLFKKGSRNKSQRITNEFNFLVRHKLLNLCQ